jgi:hypothetical protein
MVERSSGGSSHCVSVIEACIDHPPVRNKILKKSWTKKVEAGRRSTKDKEQAIALWMQPVLLPLLRF